MYEKNEQKNIKSEQKNPIFSKSPYLYTEQKSLKSDKNENNIQSFENKSSERSNNQTLKMEKAGIFYCLLAQLLWTTNSVYLKFLTQYFKGLFKNKTYLFARGLMVTFLSYCLGKYKTGKIYKLSELSPQMFKLILLRGNTNYFKLAIWVVATKYLRVSTCQILNCLAPIIVIFFSIIFLDEKFYSRYIFGIIFGIIGSSIIVLNEKNATKTKIEKEDSGFSEILIGVLSVFCSIIFGAIENISNKKLTNNKIPVSTQLFYVGFINSVYSFLWMLFSLDFDYTLMYFIMSMLHAVLFFMGNYFFNKGIQRIDLGKSSLIQYSKVVFVFVLSVIFLGQKIFFADIIGSVIIVSFMIYHIMNPVK